MRYRFIEAEKANYPINLMCKVLMVSTSGYYSWRNRPVSGRQIANETLVQKIREIHKESRQTYGSPRIYERLKAETSKNRVARLMRQNAIRACYSRKYVVTTDSHHQYEVAPNLLKREFNVGKPNQVWASDITYVPTDEGWLYLGATMDLFARRIVGWSMLERLQSGLACESLDMALSRRKVDGDLIHHSDRGIQYASDEYQLKLRSNGIRCSMSRKGDC
jgi:putative transposase